jgi:hypothetical protein
MSASAPAEIQATSPVGAAAGAAAPPQARPSASSKAARNFGRIGRDMRGSLGRCVDCAMKARGTLP